jgi:hypothetical protein
VILLNEFCFKKVENKTDIIADYYFNNTSNTR